MYRLCGRVPLRVAHFPRRVGRGRWLDQRRLLQHCCSVGLDMLISTKREGNKSSTLTSTFIAIRHAPRCTIVPSAYDSLLPHNHTAHAPLHAVASVSG